MASPFPGMDPWLESPYIWGDFHNKFAILLCDTLNERLHPPYYARIEMRPEIGVVEDDDGYVRRIGPDVSVVQRPAIDGNVALIENPVAVLSESLEVIIANEPTSHLSVEVRDPSQGHELVTLIEMISPSNKQPGADRIAYLKKQAEVFGSEASFVEIDLLRGGKRLFAAQELVTALAQYRKRVDYVVVVNRAWQRENTRTAFQVFPAMVTEPLPTIPVPLRKGQPEVLLNLQLFVESIHARSPYLRGAVDYKRPPVPPLPDDLALWAAECLRKAGVPG